MTHDVPPGDPDWFITPPDEIEDGPLATWRRLCPRRILPTLTSARTLRAEALARGGANLAHIAHEAQVTLYVAALLSENSRRQGVEYARFSPPAPCPSCGKSKVFLTFQVPENLHFLALCRSCAARL